MAARRVAEGDGWHGPTPPPVAEFGLVAELLAAILDRQGQMITAIAATAGAKNPPKVKPFPRPVTALDRARRRQAQEAADQIVAAFAPHEVQQPT